jgi:hypothetical protein
MKSHMTHTPAMAARPLVIRGCLKAGVHSLGAKHALSFHGQPVKHLTSSKALKHRKLCLHAVSQMSPDRKVGFPGLIL